MDIHLIKTKFNSYCVFSETAMSCSSYKTEEEAIQEFERGITFDPSHRDDSGYTLNLEKIELHYGTPSNIGGYFGTIIRKLYNEPLIDYEYF